MTAERAPLFRVEFPPLHHPRFNPWWLLVPLEMCLDNFFRISTDVMKRGLDDAEKGVYVALDVG
ncbi:MAG TPA: hypothetical protein ACQGQJ_11505 [Xylella fastidiosa subsp. multiplex]